MFVKIVFNFQCCGVVFDMYLMSSLIVCVDWVVLNINVESYGNVLCRLV